MKYSKVNKVLKGEIVNGYENFVNQLQIMNELNKILEKARFERNYIDFDIRDVEQVENDLGEVVDFKRAETGNAQLMIENFMVIANETVAKHFYWLPFIFRIHEEPNEQSIKEVLDLLRMSGYKIPNYDKAIDYLNKSANAPKNVSQKVNGSTALLRSFFRRLSISLSNCFFVASVSRYPLTFSPKSFTSA